MTSADRKPRIELGGGRGCGPEIVGSALVSAQGFGVRYDLDPETGVISNPAHDLFGEALKDRILVFTQPKGGVAASWALAELKRRDLAPIGLVFQRASPIFVQAAISADIALIDCLDQDPCRLIQNGDELRLFPREGRLQVYENAR